MIQFGGMYQHNYNGISALTTAAASTIKPVYQLGTTGGAGIRHDGLRTGRVFPINHLGPRLRRDAGHRIGLADRLHPQRQRLDA